MKQIQHHFILLIMLILFVSAGCAAETSVSGGRTASSTAVVSGSKNDAPIIVTRSAEEPNISKPEPTNDVLPPLPALWATNTIGIGEVLPGGEHDPFAQATFTLAADLPDSPETAVVQQHNFGQPNEADARILADQLGFTGPLYIQQIAPEFAPPEGTNSPPVFTAFDGQRILNIGHTGLNFEDRGVAIDYAHPLSFSKKAPLVEAQLKAWDLLDFPYEMRELPWGDLVVYRLIDGIAVEQNEFEFLFNQEGKIGLFAYHPLREVAVLGSYPLQTAEMAWQQLQTPEGRSTIRYQLSQSPVTAVGSVDNFVNPRSWTSFSQVGQEVHLYMTPVVYEATDGSGLRLVYGDLALTGDADELARIAAHLSDGLHVWGTINAADGVKTLAVSGWEKIETIQYETLEGTIAYAEGQALLHTMDDETFILAAAPQDIPEGIEGYVSVAARRDTGADYLVLDWLSITEKIEWPEIPEIAVVEPVAIADITVNSAELIYFPLYQTIDVPGSDNSMLFIPVWKFSGETDQGEVATFWVSAIAAD